MNPLAVVFGLLLASIGRVVTGFLRAAITPIKTTTPPANIEFDGALPNQGGLTQLFNNLISNGAPAFGNFFLTRVPAPLAARTYLGGELVGGIIVRGNTTATTDSTDTATNIVNAIPGAVNGQTFPLLLANIGSGSLTIAAGTGVTITGSATVSSLSCRLFLGQVTGSAAVTLSNCFQFGGQGTGFL